MIVKQEDETPIGDYFHDAGTVKIFEKLKDIIDDFEVETNDILSYANHLISIMKGLKNLVKQEESKALKRKRQDDISELISYSCL